MSIDDTMEVCAGMSPMATLDCQYRCSGKIRIKLEALTDTVARAGLHLEAVGEHTLLRTLLDTEVDEVVGVGERLGLARGGTNRPIGGRPGLNGLGVEASSAPGTRGLTSSSLTRGLTPSSVGSGVLAGSALGGSALTGSTLSGSTLTSSALSSLALALLPTLLATGLLTTGLLATGLLTTGLLATGLLATGLLTAGLLTAGLLANDLLLLI